MPRPQPLTNTSAIPYRDSDQQLTPRTPHSGSRTSRLEQGFSKIPLAEADDGEYDDQTTLQSAPLLASSSTARFSVHNDRGRQTATSKESSRRRNFLHPTQMLSILFSKLPLAFGIFMAGVLLILLVVSYTRPEALHQYIGVKPPSNNATSIHAASTTTSVNAPAPTFLPPEANTQLISYENYTTFPLSGHEYLLECAKLNKGYMSHGDYWDVSPKGTYDVLHRDDKSVCSSSITYMLDGTVGLTADLALMAQVAALAAERNRTFFVEDTYWNRGRWLDHFEDVRYLQPGPEPACKAPPPDELVACPRTAKHLIINSRTAKYHLGGEFSNHYEDPYGHNLNRLKPIFEAALQSFTSTIRPSAENMKFIQLARKELSSFLKDVDKKKSGAGLIYSGVHIRRGDRRTATASFPNQQIPIPDYMAAVKTTWARLHSGALSEINPVVYLATDSPEAHRQFSEQYSGETFSLFDSANSQLRALASPAEYDQSRFAELDLPSRISATRGMVVDLALVSGLWLGGNDIIPDSVVCGLSTTICRVAPIGLGWERAFGKVDQMGYIDDKTKRWVEIDQQGKIIPVWKAFQLF